GLLLCSLPSCGQDVANRYYSSQKFPPKEDYTDVELLDEAPKRPYELLADFQSRNESVRTVRKKAAEIGADAVIITFLGGTHSDDWASPHSQSRSYSHIIGTAIKYK